MVFDPVLMYIDAASFEILHLASHACKSPRTSTWPCHRFNASLDGPPLFSVVSSSSGILYLSRTQDVLLVISFVTSQAKSSLLG